MRLRRSTTTYNEDTYESLCTDTSFFSLLYAIGLQQPTEQFQNQPQQPTLIKRNTHQITHEIKQGKRSINAQIKRLKTKCYNSSINLFLYNTSLIVFRPYICNGHLPRQ